MEKFSDTWLRRVEAGLVPDAEIVHKFGRINDLTTAYAPVTASAVYQTPTTPTTLQIVSDSIEDAAAGTGAQVVEIIGIGPDWRPQSVFVTMTGLTPVTVTGTWLRVFKLRVDSSNTYANTSISSHAGAITLTEVGTGILWAEIETEGGLGVATSLIACYTVPLGYRGYVLAEQIFTQTTKPADIILVGRPEADRVTPPYATMRWKQVHYSVDAPHTSQPRGLGERMVGPYDLGYMAKAAGANASCAVLFELLLVKDY